jgi:Kdo2-lipid IVA lauroyltransferase/acyltransferase
METIKLYSVIVIVNCFNSIPLKTRLAISYFFVRLIYFALPRVKKVTERNIELVFPELNEIEKAAFLKKTQRSFARFIVDSCRFPTLSREWYLEHVATPFSDLYEQTRQKNLGKGILFASCHLGSIEFQGFVAPIKNRPLAFVARSFKSEKLNSWWCKKRELLGNKVIARKGAYHQVVDCLNKGIDVAMLIDQNVTRKHALFVKWFGRDAATTFAFGRAALATKAPVMIAGIIFLGDEKYQVIERECNVVSIYNNSLLTESEKLLLITQMVSDECQKLILESPSEWFWMHRRWKTTPEGIKEDFYD